MKHEILVRTTLKTVTFFFPLLVFNKTSGSKCFFVSKKPEFFAVLSLEEVKKTASNLEASQLNLRVFLLFGQKPNVKAIKKKVVKI